MACGLRRHRALPSAAVQRAITAIRLASPPRVMPWAVDRARDVIARGPLGPHALLRPKTEQIACNQPDADMPAGVRPKTEQIACNQADAFRTPVSVDRQRYHDTTDDHLSRARM
jgi:hypothetical protein